MTNCTDCPNQTDNTCCHQNATNGNDTLIIENGKMVTPIPVLERKRDSYFEHENEGNC